MQTSESTKAIFPAFLLAQQAFKNATKGGDNPHKRSKYATLTDVYEAVRKPLHDNGLVITHYPDAFDPSGLNITTRLVHAASGEWLEATLRVALDNGSAQEVGSAITYGRRYTLSALLGVVADEDDDGEKAAAAAPARRGNAPAPTRAAATAAATPGVLPFGRSKGTKLAEMAVQDLAGAWVWAKTTEGKAAVYATFLAEAMADLKARKMDAAELSKVYEWANKHEAGLAIVDLKMMLEERLEAARQDLESFERVPKALEGPEEGEDELPF